MKHFDPNKSYRAHDGEIVTNMHRSFAGWKGIGKDGSVYYWYDSAPGSWPTEIPPTFEAGKSYRTRDGGKATIEDDGIAYPPNLMVGRVDGIAATTISWLPSGRICNSVDSRMDLLPGAIEDETAAAAMAAWKQSEEYISAVDAAAALQADINQRKSAEVNPEAEDRHYRSDLRQLHSRLNRQAERLEFHEHDGLAKRLDALEKAAEAMPGPYAMGQRIEALEEQMTSALGITLSSRPRPATPVELAIQAINGRLDVLQGLEHQLADRLNVVRDILEGQGWDLNPKRRSMLDQIAEWPVDGCNKAATVDSAAWTGRPTPPKPTIKGGWVNVYRDTYGLMDLTDGPFPSKGVADAVAKRGRIACIQIPEITEGEGL